MKGAGLPPTAFSGGIPAAWVATRGYVEIRHDEAVPGSRLKGVGKPVDGQRAARPPVCPPRAAFPHTHRRNNNFKETSKSKSLRAWSPAIPVGQPFLAVPDRC